MGNKVNPVGMRRQERRGHRNAPQEARRDDRQRAAPQHR